MATPVNGGSSSHRPHHPSSAEQLAGKVKALASGVLQRTSSSGKSLRDRCEQDSSPDNQKVGSLFGRVKG